MEWWSNGVMGEAESLLPNAPTFHYSITPIFLISYILRKPFERQRVPQPFGFRQVIRGGADRGKLQSLGSLVV